MTQGVRIRGAGAAAILLSRNGHARSNGVFDLPQGLRPALPARARGEVGTEPRGTSGRHSPQQHAAYTPGTGSHLSACCYKILRSVRNQAQTGDTEIFPRPSNTHFSFFRHPAPAFADSPPAGSAWSPGQHYQRGWPKPRKSDSIRVLCPGARRAWLYDDCGGGARSQLRSWDSLMEGGGGSMGCPLPRPVEAPYCRRGESLASNSPLRREYQLRSLTSKTPTFQSFFRPSRPALLSSLLETRETLSASSLSPPIARRRWWRPARCAAAEGSGRCR